MEVTSLWQLICVFFYLQVSYLAADYKAFDCTVIFQLFYVPLIGTFLFCFFFLCVRSYLGNFNNNNFLNNSNSLCLFYSKQNVLKPNTKHALIFHIFSLFSIVEEECFLWLIHIRGFKVPADEMFIIHY